MKKELLVYVGEWGDYEIPKELRKVRVTADGMPDRRFKESELLLEWAKTEDEKEKRRVLSNLESFN
jgi:hypothetical protein